MKKLVIVESPTKAKTIQKFLSSDYKVESSYGHIRDLPKSKMGIDIEHDFAPQYVIPTKNRKRVTELKKLSKKAQEVYFATDEDREGEAISWHLKHALEVPDEKSKRIVFHEVTKSAIANALEHPRTIDINLVDAQQARRVLDRLVGYELSPFLWRKVTKGLSAGRVQSVALRLIVEREREIQSFVVQEYWSIQGIFCFTGDTEKIITARLFSYQENILEKFSIPTGEQAQEIVDSLQGATYHISRIEKKQTKRTAPAPFTTSSLQQEANRRLHFSTKQTMMFAQQLYEGITIDEGQTGLITYMRTDSLTLSETFLDEAQEYLSKTYGANYAKGKRAHKTKSKLAQEAHEAIRPTSAFRTPDSIKAFLTPQQYKLYDLIWRRAVASQMPDAVYEVSALDIAAHVAEKKDSFFRASGIISIFDGFSKVYLLQTDDVILPHVTQDQPLVCQSLEPEGHATKPPGRYSEATIVKALEEFGIGRPSTYAPTISTLIERNYVIREQRKLKPTEIAFLVIDLLVEHFSAVVDYQFTAKMEDQLDEVAQGNLAWVPVIRDFYFPFKENLNIKDKELSKEDITKEADSGIDCEKCGKPMKIKMSRFGKFLACTGFPECKNAKSLDNEKGEKGEGEESEESYGVCEKCASALVKKRGRFGAFLGCSKYPECTYIKKLGQRTLDISCPECKTGSVIQRRSKRGKAFYGCSRYPECKFISWTKPGEGEVDSPPEAGPALPDSK